MTITTLTSNNVTQDGYTTANSIELTANFAGLVTSLLPKFNSQVYAIAHDSSSIYIGGDFTAASSKDSSYGVILSTQDASSIINFNLFNSSVYATAIDNNYIYAGGDFTSYDNVTANKLARFYRSTGELDITFNPSIGFNSTVYSLALDSTNGKLYVGGSFTTYQGNTRNNLVRLNTSDASDDTTTFAVGTGFNGTAYSLILDSNKLYVGGNFTTYQGNSRNRLVRLNTSNASDDTATFAIGTGFDNTVWSLALDSTNGKLYVGGNFTTYQGNSRNRLVRLNTSNASDDTATFAIGTGFDNPVYSLALDSTSGKLYVGGQFLFYQGNSRAYLVRLNTSNASDDTATFPVNQAIGGIVWSLALDSTNGKLYVGGSFTSYLGNVRNYLVRLNTSNASDDTATFAVGTGFNGTVRSLTLDSTNGKLYVGGQFSTYQAFSLNRLVKIKKSDYSIDATFVVGTGFSNTVWSLALDSTNGKLYVGGTFTVYKGTSRNYLVRLNTSDASDDTATFAIGTGFNSEVRALTLDSTNGKLYVGGQFSTYQGNSRNRLVRLNTSNASDDTATFAIGTGFDGSVYSLALDSTSGKLYVGGGFTLYKSSTRNYLVRLNTSDASDDTATFAIGSGFDSWIFSLALDSTNGKLYVGGIFTTYKGNSRNYLARLNTSNASDDTATFAIGTGFNNWIYSLALDSTNGKLYVGGVFTSYQGNTRNRLVRLNTSDASDDTVAFAIGTGFNNTVRSLALDSTSGKLYVGGQFITYKQNQKYNFNYFTTLNTSNASTDNPIYSFTNCSLTYLNRSSEITPYVASYTIRIKPTSEGQVSISAFAGTDTSTTLSFNYFTSSLVRITSDSVVSAGYTTSNLVALSLKTSQPIFSLPKTNGSINSIVQDASFVYMGGNFTSAWERDSSYGVILSTQDASSIINFNLFNSSVYATAIDNNYIYAGGDFTSYDNVTANKLARFYRSTGELDISFSASVGVGFNNDIISLALDSTNGKLYVGGAFTTYKGNSRNYLVRLNTSNASDDTATFAIETGFNNWIYSLALDSTNGKLYVGGVFTSYQGNTRNRLVRLNTSDASDDTATFAVGTGFNILVSSLILDSTNSKLYVCGGFTTYQGNTRNRLVRLNTSNASDDTATFAIGTGFNNEVQAIALDSTNNKLYVGGNFTTYQGTTRNYLVRLNTSNASDDTATFAIGTGFGGNVHSLALDPINGKLYVGGAFTTYQGNARSRLVRLNTSNASDDTATFAVGTGFDNSIWTLALDSTNGRLYVGGQFTSYQAIMANFLIKINKSSYRIDTNFNIGAGFDNGILSLALDSTNGKLYVGGNFTTYQGNSRNRLVRLNTSNASDDTATFAIGTGFNSWLNSLALDSTSGKLYVSGAFTTYKGISRNYLVRLNTSDASDDTATFAIGTGFNNLVQFLTLDSANGKLYVGGNFTTYQGNSRNRLVRLNTSNASDDTATFAIGTGFDNTVNSLALDSTNGRLYVGGNFATYKGTSRNFLVRLNTSNASDDTATFAIGTGFNSTVQSLTLDSTNGKLYVGGYFTTYQGNVRNNLVRLNISNANDDTATFAVGTGFSYAVYSLALDSMNGKLYVGGQFTSYQGSTRNNTAILNISNASRAYYRLRQTLSNCSLVSLNHSLNANSYTLKVKPTTLGPVAITTSIDSSPSTTFNFNYTSSSVVNLTSSSVAQDGYIAQNIVNFKADFSENISSFLPKLAGGEVWGIAQDDEAIYIGGNFTSTYSSTAFGCTLLTSNGLASINFNKFGGTISTTLLDDTYIYVGGSFIAYNNKPQYRLARFYRTSGEIDDSFRPYFSSTIQTLTQDSDSLYVGGLFVTSAQIMASNGCCLSTTDASQLPNFNAHEGAIHAIVYDSTYVYVGGTASVGVARYIRATNQLDTNFKSGAFNGTIYSLALDSTNGKLYVGGNFTTYQGNSRNYLVRLNTSNASDDTATFAIGTGFNSEVRALTLDSANGKLYVGGAFTTYQGSSRNRLVRLNTSNASDDTAAFAIGTGFDNTVYSLALDSTNSKLYIGGQFTTYQGNSRNRLVRLNTSNASDDTATFAIGTGFDSTVQSLTLDSTNGKLYIGGSFTTYQTLSLNRLIKIKKSDYSIDTSFNIGTGFNALVVSLALDSTNGKLYVGGAFTTYKGNSRNYLVRLNTSDASDDTATFAIGTGFNNAVQSLALDSINGKLYIGGQFTTYQGVTQNRLVKLNTSNATVDATFAIGTGFDSYIYSIALDSVKGRLYAAGGFTTYKGLVRSGIAKLLTSDGSDDSTFTVGTGFGAGSSPQCLALDSTNDKIYVGGYFTTYKGNSRNYLVRLNTIDGSDDTATFAIGTGFNAAPWALAIDPTNNKLYVGGQFTTYQGNTRNGLIRLDTSNASDDTTNFAIETGFNSSGTRSLSLDFINNKVYVGGPFTTYQSQNAPFVCALNFTGKLYKQVATETFLTTTNNRLFDLSFSSPYSCLFKVQPTTTGLVSVQVATNVALNAGSTVNAASNTYSFNYNLQPILSSSQVGDNSYTSLSKIPFSLTLNSSTIGPYYLDGAIFCFAQDANYTYIGGDFTGYSSLPASYGSILNISNASQVPFDFSQFNGTVYCIVQDSNHIYAGGNFTSYNGYSANKLVRFIKATGQLDTTFAVGAGFSNVVLSLALDSTNGKLYVGGAFTTYQGNSRSYLVRLNTSDASDDTATFAVGTGFNNPVNSLTLDSTSGKLYVGGAFTTYQGSSRNRLVRLNTSDASDDTATFAIGTGFDNPVYSLALDSTSGKLYVGGQFLFYQGNSRAYLVRLNTSNASDDTATFAIGTGFNNTVRSLALDSTNGKLYVGGAFTTYQGNARNRLVKLNAANGSEDLTSFSLGTGFNNDVRSIALDIPNSKLYATGYFTTYRGQTRNYITRINILDGTDDTATFSVGTGFNGGALCAILDPTNSRLYVGGDFTLYQRTTSARLLKLSKSSYSIDTNFNVGSGLNGSALSLALDTYGKLYVGGGFTAYQGNSRNYLVRLNTSDASDDTAAFAIGTGFDSFIYSLALDSANGKLYVGGNFTTYQGNSRNRLVRLNTSNASDDTATFAIGTGFNDRIWSLALDSTSGKLYVGGDFVTYQGNSRKYLVRLNTSDASDDTATFAVGIGFNGSVYSLATDSTSGKLYVGGGFSAYQGNSRNYLVRLNTSNASDDTATFAIGTGFDNPVYSLALDSTSGKLYVGGQFLFYQGNSRAYLVRLNTSNASDDTATFAIGTGFNNTVRSLALDSTNGTLYVGNEYSNFTTYQSIRKDAAILKTLDATSVYFSAKDLIPSNGSIPDYSFSGQGSSYKFIATPSGEGLMTISVPASVIKSTVG